MPEKENSDSVSLGEVKEGYIAKCPFCNLPTCDMMDKNGIKSVITKTDAGSKIIRYCTAGKTKDECSVLKIFTEIPQYLHV